MENRSIIQKIEKLPFTILTTMVGACSLSNMYLTIGFTYIRHITMICATIVLLAYIIKISLYFNTFKQEYSNTVPASIYGGFSMVTMMVGSYFFDFNPVIGKGIWFAGVIIHVMQILVFTYRNVLTGVKIDTFVPSWFVTYNGIMVAVVVGGPMNEPIISKMILCYGIFIYALIIPFMIYRIATKPIKDSFYHTQAIVLAPASLCIVNYLNVIKEPNLIVVSILYVAVLVSLLFVLYKLPKFFSYSFTPAFAALTFPMAIGVAASVKMSAFLTAQGEAFWGNIVRELSGIQINITTAVIGFLLYNLLRIFAK